MTRVLSCALTTLSLCLLTTGPLMAISPPPKTIDMDPAVGQSTQDPDLRPAARGKLPGAIPGAVPGAVPGAGCWAPAVNPKALSPQVRRGLAWLVAHQNNDGGWGQGEESSQMGRAMDPVRDQSNVADTCIAALALIRAGSTPSAGPHARELNRAVGFVCGQIEAADADSLWITSVRGTRVQGKIGQYVDTFLGAMLLAEVKDQMPDQPANQRVLTALDKTLVKIQKHQQADGGWNNQGWAGGLGAAMGNKALNRAAQVGGQVNEDALTKAQASAQRGSKTDSSGRFAADGKSAGIELYAAASGVGGLADASNTNTLRRAEADDELTKEGVRIDQIRQNLAATPAASAPARMKLESELKDARERVQAVEKRIAGFDAVDQDLAQAKQALIKRMEDDGFVAGFGNNGGEEFLSHLQIGETLVIDGGNDFRKWDQQMTQNLNRVQNNDGSWTGHHCITGRTFCTAAALLVLTVDRAPVPLAGKVRG